MAAEGNTPPQVLSEGASQQGALMPSLPEWLSEAEGGLVHVSVNTESLGGGQHIFKGELSGTSRGAYDLRLYNYHIQSQWSLPTAKNRVWWRGSKESGVWKADCRSCQGQGHGESKHLPSK